MNFIKLLIASSFFIVFQSDGAVQALLSRVVYNEGVKSESLTLRNNANDIYMVETWIENGEDNKGNKIPFITNPPLMKIEPGKDNVVRIVYSGKGLPEDKESQFWINVQEIPQKPKGKNILQIALRTELKLFYRPKSLKIDLKEAVKQVDFYVEDNSLYIKNNSPLFITIGDLKFNDNKNSVKLLKDMISPYSSNLLYKNLPLSTKAIKFSYINEYGGNTYVEPINIK